MIYILGGGIAGLLLAEKLEELEVPWQLWERHHAPNLNKEASARNAGIIRSYEADPVAAALAQQALAYYHNREPSFCNCGIALVPWEVNYAEKYHECRLYHGKVGIFLDQDGTVEPQQVLLRLRTKKYRHGTLQFGLEGKIAVENGVAICHSNGQKSSREDSIVVACGEGAVKIAFRLGYDLGLVAHLRTLYEYKNTAGFKGPVQWDEETSCYFRVSGETLTATAGEQIPQPLDQERGEIEADPQAPQKIEQVFGLNPLDIVSWRSCRRLMAPDHRPYCGRDPRIANLYWLTGLGGRGMSIAPALAQLLAQQIVFHKTDPLLEFLTPARVLG
ncbi:MAG: FAD-binding oxidoreductase [Leptospiraceae bacterium]|nr:FAD-binding oxidoreductase [Leptospiraceae bacterium]